MLGNFRNDTESGEEKPVASVRPEQCREMRTGGGDCRPAHICIGGIEMMRPFHGFCVEAMFSLLLIKEDEENIFTLLACLLFANTLCTANEPESR